jgi:hypothetical protein
MMLRDPRPFTPIRLLVMRCSAGDKDKSTEIILIVDGKKVGLHARSFSCRVPVFYHKNLTVDYCNGVNL